MNSAISVQLALTSGEITSGFIGNAAVVSGSLASGLLGGGTAFSALTSGVNTQARMDVGIGAQMRAVPGATFGLSTMGASGYFNSVSGFVASGFALSGAPVSHNIPLSGFIPFNVVIGDQTTGPALTNYNQANVLLGPGAGFKMTIDFLNFITYGRGNVAIGYQAMFNTTFGGDNIAMGTQSLSNNVGGNENVAIGLESLFNSTGDSNTAVGFGAGESCTGSSNSFFGAGAGRDAGNGNNNVFIGLTSNAADAGAGQANAVAVGANALAADGCVTIGANAGSNNGGSGLVGINFNLILIGTGTGVSLAPGGGSDSTDDIFIGTNAGTSATTGQRNVFIGTSAGASVTIGNFNTFIGYFAGKNQIDQIAQVAIGFEALQGSGSTTGSQNNVVGYQAFANNSTGLANTGLGHQVGLFNTTGSWNTFIGNTAGSSNVDGGHNTYIGANAGLAASSTTDSDNTFVGYNAGNAANNSPTGQNIVIGSGAAPRLVSGSDVVIIGFQADVADVSGATTKSVAIGNLSHAAFQSVTLGYNSGSNLTVTDTSHVLIGYQTGNSLGTGGSTDQNVFIGFQCGGTSQSSLNVIIGAQADVATSTSTNAVALGYLSKAEDSSVALGAQTAALGANSVLIGFGLSSSFANDFQIMSGNSGFAEVGAGILSVIQGTGGPTTRGSFITGGFHAAVAAAPFTTDQTYGNFDFLFVGDTTGGAVNFNLPPANLNTGGRIVAARHIAGGSALKLVANGTDTIEGNPDFTVVNAAILISDPTNTTWYVISAY